MERGYCLRFGPFSLRFPSAELLRDGVIVPLGSRAKDLLRVLAEHGGQTLTNTDLIGKVWPDTVVVAANLGVQIKLIREALGDRRSEPRYILNDPGRGYRFIAAVTREEDEETPREPAPALHRTNLPQRLAALVGRDAAAEQLTAQMAAADLVTIVGPAGVGKTSLAMRVSRSLLETFPDGVWFIDLAAIHDGQHIATTVAATMGLHLGSPDPDNDLCYGLTPKRALLIFDNCEHLLEPVAALVELIRARCGDITILATSREPLRVMGEVVHHLAVLEAPASLDGLEPEQILQFSAVQLFMERVTASWGTAERGVEEARAAAIICKRLDGIPLALEVAAGLVGVFGFAGLVQRLEQQEQLPAVEIRGVKSRHRTLTNALEWSYELLNAVDRDGLTRLAVLKGGFTVASACAVLKETDAAIVSGLLARLHAKSLITSEMFRSEPRFRLLETTRAFALQKLEASGQAVETRHRHATHFRDLLRPYRLNMGQRDIVGDGIELDNVRSALRFALSENGDAELALSLICGAMPLWFSLSLVYECGLWLEQVIDRLRPDQLDTPLAWEAIVSLRLARLQTSGVDAADYASWPLPPEDENGEPMSRRPMVGDTLTRIVFEWRRNHATEFRRLIELHRDLIDGSGLLYDRLVSICIFGIANFEHGSFATAREELTEFLATETVESRRMFTERCGQDRNCAARGRLAALLCLIGETEAGFREAVLAIDAAEERIVPQCEALQWSFAAYEIAGVDPGGLDSGLENFVERARRHRLEGPLACGLGLRGIRARRAGRYLEAESLLRSSVEIGTRAGVETMGPWIHGELGLAIALLGRPKEGLRVATEYAARDRNPTGWCGAQLQRAIGLLHELNGDTSSARKTLSGAVKLARAQGAVAWQRQIERDITELDDPAIVATG